MNIEIKSPATVLVDGKNYGSVADTIANNPKLVSTIQAALVAYVESKDKAAADQLASTKDASKSLLEASESRAVSALSGMEKQLLAVKADFDAYRASVESASKAIKAVITDTNVDDAATLKAVTEIVAIGEVQANKPALQKQLETLQDEIEAKQKAAYELKEKLK